ncbi:MAG: isoaspartyl peptidase/L-asparaginase [Betaproteobacteria bacterium]
MVIPECYGKLQQKPHEGRNVEVNKIEIAPVKRPSLAIHGGCGTPAREALPDDAWEEMRHHLANALRRGWLVLKAGGPALDAVQAAVVVLEDSPHFNAGHGSAFTREATHELDASIIDGRDGRAGAVCVVCRVRNPVLAARAVLDHGECVLLAGGAADRFAESRGLVIADNGYVTTPRRAAALAVVKAANGALPLGAVAPTEADRHGTARDAHIAQCCGKLLSSSPLARHREESRDMGAGSSARVRARSSRSGCQTCLLTTACAWFALRIALPGRYRLPPW